MQAVEKTKAAPAQGPADRKSEVSKLKPAQRGELRFFEASNNVHAITVPAGIEPEQLDLHPSFWNSLSDDLNEGDTIEAVSATRAWFATFRCVAVTPGRVVIRLCYKVDGAPVLGAVGPKPMPEGYRIQRTQPGDARGNGYVVIREKDNFEILASGGVPWPSYQEAYEDFLKSAIFRSAEKTRYLP